MAMAKALAALVLLGVVSCALGAPACVDSSTQFFGAPWDASFVDAEQESDYKLWGALVGAALLFNKDTGCVQAVQGTYGPEVPSSSLLGLKASSSSSSSSVLRKELQLAEGEVFDYVEYKAGSCIAYLQLATNKGRALAVGNPDAELSLQSNRPAAGSFLGFFKATLEPPSAEAAAAAAPVPTEGSTPLRGKGALKQLQLVWVRDCASIPATEEPADPVSPALSAPAAAEQHAELHMPEDVPAAAPGAAAADTDALSPTWGDHDSEADLVTAAEPEADAETANSVEEGVQVTQFGSDELPAGRDGAALRAATSPASCTAKNAIGFYDGSVPTSSCSLSGLGKEVAALACFGTNLLPTAAAESLSACSNLACKLSKDGCESTGAFGVGSFCTGKVVSMGSTAKLHSLGESWLGYPCIEVKDIKAGLAAAAAGGDYSAKGAYVAKSWKVCDCAAAGITAQTTHDKSGNITIKLPEVPIPRVTITTFPVEIQPPNFTLPAFPSKALNLAGNFSLPASLQALAKIANFTALDLDLPNLNFTLPSLPTLQIDSPGAGLALLSSLPHVLKFEKPVTNMTVPDVLGQWLAATVSKATLPRIVVPNARVNALKALIPGFTAPSVVMPTYLSALLSKVPASLELPSFSVPSKTLPSVSLLLPNLTSLPSIVLPAEAPKEVRLPPLLTMHNVSLPTFQGLARHLLDSLPSVELSFNVPDILAQWVAGLVQGSPLQQLNVSDSSHAQLKEMLPDMPDKGPALLLLNITSPFLAQPVIKELLNLPTVVVPDSLIKNVSALLPALTSLPSILTAKLPAGNLTVLPQVKLPEITIPGLRLTINKVLADLPSSLNMTQGITDWLEAHTSLLGKAGDGPTVADSNATTGSVDVSVGHSAAGMDGGLAAAVEQMAGAKAAAVTAGVSSSSSSEKEAPAAAAPNTAAATTDAPAAGEAAPAAAAPAAADVPAGPVVAGAPLQEAEVKTP